MPKIHLRLLITGEISKFQGLCNVVEKNSILNYQINCKIVIHNNIYMSAISVYSRVDELQLEF